MSAATFTVMLLAQNAQAQSAQVQNVGSNPALTETVTIKQALKTPSLGFKYYSLSEYNAMSPKQKEKVLENPNDTYVYPDGMDLEDVVRQHMKGATSLVKKETSKN